MLQNRCENNIAMRRGVLKLGHFILKLSKGKGRLQYGFPTGFFKSKVESICKQEFMG